MEDYTIVLTDIAFTVCSTVLKNQNKINIKIVEFFLIQC